MGLAESISNCISGLIGLVTKRTDRNDSEIDRLRVKIDEVKADLSTAISDGRITDVASLNKELVRLRHELASRGGAE